MLQAFYTAIWYPISTILFHLVTIPSMSMFPFRPHLSGWRKWCVIALASIASGLCARGLNLLGAALGIADNYLMHQLYHLFAMVLFCALLYRGRFLSKLLTIILALSLAGQIGFVYGSGMRLLGAPDESYVVMIRDVLGYGTFALYYFMLRKYSNVTSFYLSRWDHALLIVIAFFLFILSCISLRYFETDLQYLLFCTACAFATVTITFLLFRFTREHEKTMDQQLLLQDLRLSETALAQMKETSAQIKELRHELSNHFTYLDMLVEEGRYDEVHTYLRRAEHQSRDAAQTITTASPVVNAIVNQKLSYARSLGIQTQAQVILPDHLPLDDIDLCSLLGNLLNNAIEACQNQRAPVIDLQISPVKNHLIFQVENTVTHDVLAGNPALLSTKADSENHGIGLRVIRRITEATGGILRYEMTAPDHLAVRVLLPC